MEAIQRGVLIGLAVLVASGWVPVPSGTHFLVARPDAVRLALPVADFGASTPSPQARQLADWVAGSRDHQDQAFFVVDKVGATLYVFDGDARLQASTPVLLGLAHGDDSVPGIGTRAMAQILPAERTTPAGRFVAEGGRNHKGEDIVWVDHEAAVSMHRVRTANPLEQRAQRLASPTVDDNRISFGCINVPEAFYNQQVQALFATRRTAIVYVLPETRSLQAQFGMAVQTAGTASRTR